MKARSFLSISKNMEMAVDLMVIHLSCSSFLVSVALVSPALEAAMIQAFATSESVSVDLPWSTWAITDMFRIFFFLSIHSRTSSILKFTMMKTDGFLRRKIHTYGSYRSYRKKAH